MNRFNDYVPFLFSSPSGRENVEWCNFWFDQANSTGLQQRILLIGSSTQRKLRSLISKAYKCPVDLFASSAPLHDSMFACQLDAFFMNDFKYDKIFVQVGCHNIIHDGGIIHQRTTNVLKNICTSL